MTVSTYNRDDSGIITYNGAQDEFCNEFSFLEYFALHGIEPQTERLTGWPHNYVRWFGTVGIGG